MHHERIIFQLSAPGTCETSRPDPVSGPDSEPITKIVREIVHVDETRADLMEEEEPVLIEWRAVRDGNGSGGLIEDTARTKR
jgi:hypothetical protein